MRRVLPLLGVLLLSGACADETGDPAARGERVYLASCIACHNPDPSLDGVMGPAVTGASLELLEARLLRAGYPDGYRPKRETSLMQALPYLKSDLPALAAYLAVATE
jgi:mono/diheme cytochrome c family protein